MAAVTDEPDSNRVLTEDDWNTRSSLERNPYYYSKTLAERGAWDFVRQRQPLFDSIAINPFLVIGPSLVPGLNTSNQVFVDLLKGTYPGIVGLTWGFVDVRDVAAAHVRAMDTPSASGRYICAGGRLDAHRGRCAEGNTRLAIPPASCRPILDNPVGDVIVKLGLPAAERRGVVSADAHRPRAALRHEQNSW